MYRSLSGNDSLSIRVRISDESCIGAARRIAANLAQNLNFSENDVGKISIIATELATNLHKYAYPNGLLLIQVLKTTDKPIGIQLLSVDKGPGMSNVAECLRDGYSTQQTAGTGLGAIIRLANFFNLYSLPPKGTVVIAELYLSPQPAALLEIGSICLPKSGEQECGDAWAVKTFPQMTRLLVADGLGHGKEAATAAQLACQTFNANPNAELKYVIKQIDQALRKTRGAAVAIVEINPAKAYMHFVGLGNISGQLWNSGKTQHLIGQDGFCGLGCARPHESVYSWQKDSILVMHSDGLATRWSFKDYVGLTSRHPALIAGTLYRDFVRGYDDVTVLVAKNQDVHHGNAL